MVPFSYSRYDSWSWPALVFDFTQFLRTSVYNCDILRLELHAIANMPPRVTDSS